MTDVVVAIAMPAFGFSLAVFDLLALRSNTPYILNLTGGHCLQWLMFAHVVYNPYASEGGMADLCQYASEQPPGTVIFSSLFYIPFIL